MPVETESLTAESVAGSNILMDIHNEDSVVQGTWIIIMSSNSIDQHWIQNSPAAQNDEITFKVYLSKGTYKVNTIYVAGSASGIHEVEIDGVSILSYDAYASPTEYNSEANATVTINTSGLKTMTFKVTDKNASSSGYGMGISRLSFMRTA